MAHNRGLEIAGVLQLTWGCSYRTVFPAFNTSVSTFSQFIWPGHLETLVEPSNRLAEFIDKVIYSTCFSFFEWSKDFNGPIIKWNLRLVPSVRFVKWQFIICNKVPYSMCLKIYDISIGSYEKSAKARALWLNTPSIQTLLSEARK